MRQANTRPNADSVRWRLHVSQDLYVIDISDSYNFESSYLNINHSIMVQSVVCSLLQRNVRMQFYHFMLTI